MATRKVRFKKLNAKTQLPIIRGDQIDADEYDSIIHETQISTGVDQAEEKEVHLQSILKATGISSGQEIPVPPPLESKINYKELYPLKLKLPTNYIRFSETVEECVGCSYDMTSVDNHFLIEYNRAKQIAERLSEDDFEKIMDVFEQTTSYHAPLSNANSPILPYDAMAPGITELGEDHLTAHAKDIYEYWRSRRLARGNKPIHPKLKFETNLESDDMDPYVCFRRREVRQTRKTRNRDLHSGDKLKRLRRELEAGRQLLLVARDLETKRREALVLDQKILDARARLKHRKVWLGIKANDEDLYNERPTKKRATETAVAARQQPSQLRINTRQEPRLAEPELSLLSDLIAERETQYVTYVRGKAEEHRAWNHGWLDYTARPPSPTQVGPPEPTYRKVEVEIPITPPLSDDGSSKTGPVHVARGGGGSGDVVSHQGEFRLRIGRLGRLWVDRRGAPTGGTAVNTEESDRFKYDRDSDDDETSAIVVDPNNMGSIMFRYSIPSYAQPKPPGVAIGIQRPSSYSMHASQAVYHQQVQAQSQHQSRSQHQNRNT